MRKEDLKRMARNPKNIEGIYNYCDRWCERCTFTSRCLNFAMGQEEDRRNPKSRDINNREFWDRMFETFQATLEMIAESAAKHGISLDDIDPRDMAAVDAAHDEAEKHPLSRSAGKYDRAVDRWFKKHQKALEAKQADLERLERMDLPGHDPVGASRDIADAMDVVAWYQHLIRAKIFRALAGRDRNDELAEEFDFPKDSDGSAKVALISIDRSLAAWARLLEHFPDQEESVLANLVQLERLRRAVEDEFPAARKFQRPGFDYLPE